MTGVAAAQATAVVVPAATAGAAAAAPDARAGGVLEIADLTKRFGDVTALDGLSMRVEPGRLHGFVGRNGAGKTTTMRIVLGLLDADAGTVTWAGEPLDGDRRRRVGYMPEERGLYPKMEIVEQVAYFGEMSGMTAGQARAGARRWLEQLGLADRLGDRAEALSLGNQQRVQLATALVQEPELLVLDEPFAGLDPVGVDVLAGVLGEQAGRGAAIVFSSHQLDMVERLCHTVTVIDGGRVLADGPIPALRASRARPLVRVQVEGDPPGGPWPWAEGLAHVRAVRADGNAAIVELDDPAADQGVLDAARAAGRVAHFERVVPTLAELFREVVSP